MNNLIGTVAVKIEDGRKTLIPLTSWSQANSSYEYWFTVPFEKPYPLLNWNIIHQQNHAEICLVDSVELAHYNQISETSHDRIWTSWYGDIDAIPDVRWEILENRKVTYYLIPHSGRDMQDIYRTALRATHYIQSVPGITLEFIEYDQSITSEL